MQSAKWTLAHMGAGSWTAPYGGPHSLTDLLLLVCWQQSGWPAAANHKGLSQNNCTDTGQPTAMLTGYSMLHYPHHIFMQAHCNPLQAFTDSWLPCCPCRRQAG